MYRPITLVSVALGLCACTPAQLDRFDAGIVRLEVAAKRVNAGAVRIEEAVRDLCPAIQGVNFGAATIACAVHASGESRDTLERFAEYGNQFCSNPTSKGLGQMLIYAARGLEAARRASSAGCGSGVQ